LLAAAAGTGHDVVMTQLADSRTPPAVPRERADSAIEVDEDAAARRSNWLRAGVLGANDGIVSVAAIVVGVAGATSAHGPVVVAGLAALIGGAVSMALGEYVSVSSQRDSQRAARRGQHSGSDASPWAAASASAVSFLAGGILPLLAVLLLPSASRVLVTVAVVLVALAATGAAGARLGGARALRPTLRTVLGGGLALLLTFAIGHLLGTTGVV
jgi:VIT1/CCC1 family predicted Fe2+/Mn2+ transporter